MASRSKKFSYRIGHRAGEQGPRPSAGNQAEVEKQPRSQGSLPPAPWSERERDPGKRWSRVSQNLGDYKKRFGGGAGKCEIFLYRAYTGQRSHQTVYLT